MLKIPIFILGGLLIVTGFVGFCLLHINLVGIRVWVYKVGKLKFGLSLDARMCSNKKSYSILGAAF